MTPRLVPRLSLRMRATLAGTLLFATVLTVGDVLLVTTLEDRLTAASDQVSRSRLTDLLDLARTGDLPVTIRSVGDDGIAQVVGADGEVRAASANVADRPAVAEVEASADPRTSTFRAPDDEETETYRFWYASGPSPDGRVTVYVGDSLEAVGEASSALRRSLWLGTPAVALALGALIWLLLGRALGRLDRIRAEVDRISEDNLDARVAGDGVDDEVGRLAATMNAMLERVERAVRHQRELVADVSHDLQGPLTSQRLAVELALAQPETADVRQLGADVLATTSDMEGLVRDLLVLASLDAGAAAAPVMVDLDALVLEEATRSRVGARVEIDTTGVSAAPAYADPADVRRIVRNLVDNATAFATGRVSLVVDVDGPWARLDVVDDGPGVPPEDRDRVFERFHRADAARTHGTGSGLGLPIAQGLAERAGGSLELLPSTGGAHLRLLLPSGPP